VFRSRWLGQCELLLLGCLVLSSVFSARAQGLRTVIEPRNKVFPQTEAGVTAIKRSPSGLYYVLAKPWTSIWVYGVEGNLVNRIPNAKSNGASIRYAADLDISPDGLIVVADRAANMIEVFRPDGSLVSRATVAAPTSVVALSNDLFAVTSLVSKRLVQIIDERGKVIRSFGDPSDLSDTPPEKQALADWGTISGDSAGGIYFAFASVPDPTLRKYDRYGYLGYQASVPKEMFSIGGTQPSDRVEVSLGFSDVSLSDQTTGWVTLGSSTDLKFGGGVGMGLSDAIRRGFGPAAFQQTMSQPGQGSGPVGATFSGEVTPQGTTNFQLGMGRMSSFGGRGRGRGNSSTFNDQSTSDGGILQFSSGDNGTSDSDSSDWLQGTSSASGTTAELGMSGSSGTGASSDSSTNYPGGTNPAWGFGGLPGGFVFGSAVHSFAFRQPGFGGGGGLDRPPGGSGFGHPQGGVGTGSATSGGTGPEDSSHYGYHGHFRPGMFAFTGVVRVNLGDLGRISQVDKPRITAMAADPETQEIWAGIGDTLVHFSKDGAPMGVYYLALNGGTPLEPTALLIEPNRIVVAADPWGIFEFPRPDKPSTPELNVVPQVTPPQPQ
jgi:hypothetical protein